MGNHSIKQEIKMKITVLTVSTLLQENIDTPQREYLDLLVADDEAEGTGRMFLLGDNVFDHVEVGKPYIFVPDESGEPCAFVTNKSLVEFHSYLKGIFDMDEDVVKSLIQAAS